MAIRCPTCKKEFDITLFEFGKIVTCVCGNLVSLQHKENFRELLNTSKDEEGGLMASISFKVESIYCYECVMALRKFIGNIKGVQSVDMIGDDKVIISYNPSDLDFEEEKLKKLVIDSIDKLGFKIIEE